MHVASSTEPVPVLDVLDAGEALPEKCSVRAWRPPVAGISEVFHAKIVNYRYPLHAHDTWTVLIVDAGAIEYDLDTRHCGVAGDDYVAVLPPGVVHDGHPATNVSGFRKRNLYLDQSFLSEHLIGAAVDKTTLRDSDLRIAVARLHRILEHDLDPLDVESRLALIAERLTRSLTPGTSKRRSPEPAIAVHLRALLDDGASTVSLADASRILDRSVPHLVRSFTRAYGISPHAYLIGRRVDAARKLLLTGMAPGDVAFAVGFYDQSHLTRHFRRHTSTTPAAFGRHRS